MNLEDYAHQDIDTFNMKQLYEYGAVVTAVAVEIIKKSPTGLVAKDDLIDAMKSGILGPSEIAFGIMVGCSNGILESTWINPKTYIRLVKNV